MRIAIVATALLAGSIMWTLPAGAREAGVAEGVTRHELFTEPMAGEPGEDVVTDTYSIPAGAVLPWHIHPDAHEVSYILSGTLTLEIEGEGSKRLEAGESFYLHPNAVHRGLNEGTEPVKLFVVRIKPKDEPLAVNVAPPKSD
jgi:quercetin dioxygenase-like cupin family protein